MASLERTLRKDLERTVKQARRVAEAGARNAVEQLGVGEAEAPKHLSTELRALRNRLRAHGRQLGDRRDPKGVQATARLVQECAYEHWHRMLFARFLAESDLLIEPESGMAITLDEVQELALEKATDWLPLASDYAERMLPQIFRKDDPVLQIALPPETRSAMEDLLNGLTKPVFEADDSLGWVYQFWQSDKKDEVNKSEVKIGADELPAVTQLFTEDYMVLFLLHNTLGAWWAGKVLAANPSLAASAPDEATLRSAFKVGDIDWTFLRFVRERADDGTEGRWRPAAGVFGGWPKAAKDVTVLDPCMGSGHFLVFALPILVALRMAEEGLSISAAVDAVLRDNLFGLEIDPRCTQIAAFNLAFAAWRKFGHRPLPQLNLACSGLAIGVTKAEWLKLAEKAVTAADPAAKRDLLGVEKNLLTVGLEERVKKGLETLYDLFAKAPWLGSLIDPRRSGGDFFREGFDKLEPLLSSILAAADTADTREMAVAARGMAKAAEILASQFTLVATNVPYVGFKKQDPILAQHAQSYADDAKHNLATVFVQRCLDFSESAGTSAVVTQQNFLFLGSYKALRERLLSSATFGMIASLGAKAFATPMWDFSVCLAIVSKRSAEREDLICGIEAASAKSIDAKVSKIRDDTCQLTAQIAQRQNPDSRITFSNTSGERLEKYAFSMRGIVAGDLDLWTRYFWEVPLSISHWRPLQTTFKDQKPYTGRTLAINWNTQGEGMLRPGTRNQAYGNNGVAVCRMGEIKVSLYSGDLYDQNVATIVPFSQEDLPAIWSYCSSMQYQSDLRAIDQKLNITNATLVKVPFDIFHWREVAAKEFPDGLPSEFSSDPTQWLFNGSPSGSEQPLQVAVARLLGYQWQLQADKAGCDQAVPGHSISKRLVDEDGLVCLSAIKGEPPAGQRLNALLADDYADGWSAAKLASLLADAGFAGKSLDDWLRDGFFAQHCELFHQCPFIWHIWDGRRDGFHALVNYHRLAAPNGEGRRTLEKLIYSYLGDWIDRQRAEQRANFEGADARLAHAEHLKTELIKILEGEPPYDIFVRWKPLHEQPLGWDPDINDGVRTNIRSFMTARPLGAKSNGACILITTPKINWDKDRGKEPTRDKADYPWFWSWDETSGDFAGGAKFDGNRWNNLHYSRAVKQAARDRHFADSGAKP